MLTVHHLQRGQSERIVWLCEELNIPYELKLYPRDPRTFMSPPELQALHPSKSAPIVQDGGITLAESGAIFEYILTKYGDGKLSVSPSADNYADYLYFLHFANGTLQPALLRARMATKMGLPPDDIGARLALNGMKKSLKLLNDRLSASQWLAGDEFTAADIMVVFSLTTMRLFFPYSLQEYQGILGFLQRVNKRDAYRSAIAKSDPGFQPPMSAEAPAQ
ncbi:putative glutathione S-transferase [Emericellopsis atlantica]|uniref:glutathione transferase n=1 Tax=Emericellopsis atlantica TaxID=2614577 RepID=A0A9P7ZIW7_9HYPO|nr:putative glutathione S-transferase [Emericellopsis atlantica]KAG9252924.1 putative glutathione S-transferase [Emericellopsis atlantica]